MGDLNDLGNSPPRLKERSTGRWRSIRYVGGSYRIPVPPGPEPAPNKAEREEEARAKARGDVQVARLHLVGLFGVGLIVSCLALFAVIVMFVVVLMGH